MLKLHSLAINDIKYGRGALSLNEINLLEQMQAAACQGTCIIKKANKGNARVGNHKGIQLRRRETSGEAQTAKTHQENQNRKVESLHH